MITVFLIYNFYPIFFLTEGKDEETLNDLLLLWTGYPCLPSSANYY